jgi:hypothetical protein
MPSLQELLGIVVVVFVIWLLLKMAQVAIRLILFAIALLLFVGALYFLFVR